MNLIQKKINDFLDENSVDELRKETGIGCKAIYSIRNGYKNKKYTNQTLDMLYEFFNVDKDDFYYENLKKWLKSDESILGSLLKKRREKLNLTKLDVANTLKGTVREISRIEAGDVAPKLNSYYLRELLKLYGFTESEGNQIRWYVSSLHDIIELNRKH